MKFMITAVMTVLLGQIFPRVLVQAATPSEKTECSQREMRLECRNVTSLPPLEGYETLFVEDSKLARLVKEELNSTTLKTVTFARNQIEELGDGAFQFFTNLASLHLQANVISSPITWCTFNGLDKLIELRLENQQISMDSFCQCQTTANEDVPFRSSPCGGLTVLQKLEVLSLNHNPIKSLSDDVFLPLNKSQVRVLNLDNCELQQIYDGTFAPLGQLNEFTMRNNKGLNMTVVAKISSRLSNLTLAGNDFGTIPKGSFPKLSDLQRLDLSNCNLKSIENGAFSTLTSLKYMDLSMNKLEIGSDAIFAGLKTLDSLYLRNNTIRFEGAKSPFKDLNGLKTLDLSGNLITLLSYNLLMGMDSLQNLLLTGNNIRAWNSAVLGAKASLEILRLGQNDLSEVTKVMLTDLKKVKKMDLSENKFQCNCQIYDFYGWAAENSGKLELWQNDTYKCQGTNDTLHSLRDEGEKLLSHCRGGQGNTDDGGFSTGASSGLGVGIFFLVCLCVGCCYYKKRRRRRIIATTTVLSPPPASNNININIENSSNAGSGHM
ncbi:unnamed protein product [Darwinula stevensoni]|uniref:Uncharacterized protein n=1 Tax=Darwinula stevensoni TaxID=69355 RepID=A0A7R9ACL8_9CRUS|nr:unnamed protein product [Darwinula stevensoni]CAG0899944.1 unnamed protein product [Darwinula stevensoni]